MMVGESDKMLMASSYWSCGIEVIAKKEKVAFVIKSYFSEIFCWISGYCLV